MSQPLPDEKVSDSPSINGDAHVMTGQMEIFSALFAASVAVICVASLVLWWSHSEIESATRELEQTWARKAQMVQVETGSARTAMVELDRQLVECTARLHEAESTNKWLQVASAILGGVLACSTYALFLKSRQGTAKLIKDFESRVKREPRELPTQNEPLDLQNEQLRLALEDIKGREQFLRTILTSSPFILWAVDLQGVYTLREGKGLTVLGQEPGHGVGQRAAEVMSSNPQFAECTQRAMKGEVFSAELTFRGRWYTTRFAPLKGKDGEITGVVGVSTDITDRKEAEQKMISEESARQANRMKSEFLDSMNHEIRTPMNGIVGMAGLLSQTPLSDDQHGMLDAIQNNANALVAVVNDILDLSKLEAGRLELEKKNFDLRALIEEALSLLSPVALGKGLELISDFDSSIPTQLSGDSERLRQVLNSMVGNAIKFTKRGHVLVRVRKTQETGQRVSLRFDFVDTGVGISREAQEKLFVPFVAGTRSTTRKLGATGLGLAISKQLIELMGGKIGLTSELGEGSNFWVEVELQSLPEASSQAAPTFHKSTRILVVDDNEVCRGILALKLSARGALVDIAADATGALTMCLSKAREEKPYAVVVVDRYLLGGDAVQFARAVRGQPTLSGTKLVLLSPDGSPRDSGLNGLFQAIEPKPVREFSLLGAIATALGSESAKVVAVAPDKVLPREKNSLRLLLAEDNAMNQRVAKAMLAKQGHQVDIASDGVEALRMIETGVYDAVLMDCQMPLMDGYEVTRRVRAVQGASSKVRIIALTANATDADRQLCFDSGMDDFITKPLRMNELEAALAQCGAVGMQAG